MSYILRRVRPANLMNWIKANAPASARPTVVESWNSYLRANGGTGQTTGELEATFLAAQLATGGTRKDAWVVYLSANTGATHKEKARNKYQ